MKKITTLFALIILAFQVFSQTGIKEEFEDGVLATEWESEMNGADPAYDLTEENGALTINTDKGSWNGLWYVFASPFDLSNDPQLSVKVWTDTDVSIRIYLWNSDGNYGETAISFFVPASPDTVDLYFDWEEAHGSFNLSNTAKILINFSPGGPFQGIVHFDDFFLGDEAINPFPPVGQRIPLDSVDIIIEQDSIDVLDAAPYGDDDVHGGFYDVNLTYYDTVQLHYRGAYNLGGLIGSGAPQRNWKVKFNKDQMYRNRREWNYNYDNNVQQVLAYQLMRDAGVKVPSARHINLYLNDVRHGIYLEYEDPDNKDWLFDAFGDDSGDLYKAAYDLPNETRYFAGTNYLGMDSADNSMHYRKKTNHKKYPDDFTAVRDFLIRLNYTPNAEFVDTISKYFDVESFIKYLVVANYISHWDGFPARPKNYWLYDNPANGKFTFIPWDMDATFGLQTTSLNEMGTDASIFYQLDSFDDYARVPNEGTERTLATRLMEFAEFRNAYINEYNNAMNTYLNKDTLVAKVDSFSNLIYYNSEFSEFMDFNNSVVETKAFISMKNANVLAELDTTTLEDTVAVTTPINPPAEVLDWFANPEKYAYDYSTKYTLTVNLGSGEGEFNAAVLTSISADTPPVGQEFDAWVGDIQYLADPNSAVTDVTMPAANVNVTATYRIIDNILALNLNSFSLYPNPANNMAMFRFETMKAANIQLNIYDLSGKKLVTAFNSKVPKGINEIAVDVSELNNGVYIYQFLYDGHSTKNKLIIQH